MTQDENEMDKKIVVVENRSALSKGIATVRIWIDTGLASLGGFTVICASLATVVTWS